MYRIGQFSRITRVTVKALRFYEEEGLIRPCHVDTATGYRYYDSSQLPVMHKIVALKQCGFSIPEIRMLLAGKNTAALFAERRRGLEAHARETGRQLASITHYLETMGKESGMRYEVVIKELPRVLVYSKRFTVDSYDSYFTEIPKLGEEVAAANPDLRCADDPPYCFIMYHDGEYRDHDIDIEYCEAVTKPGVETGTIRFKIIDHIPQAACVLHRGPYCDLGAAYAAVFNWIEDNGLAACAPPRESYIDGIWNRSDEADWLTEVQVPVSSPI